MRRTCSEIERVSKRNVLRSAHSGRRLSRRGARCGTQSQLTYELLRWSERALRSRWNCARSVRHLRAGPERARGVFFREVRRFPATWRACAHCRRAEDIPARAKGPSRTRPRDRDKEGRTPTARDDPPMSSTRHSALADTLGSHHELASSPGSGTSTRSISFGSNFVSPPAYVRPSSIDVEVARKRASASSSAGGIGSRG